jgi:hypothetical protein
MGRPYLAVAAITFCGALLSVASPAAGDVHNLKVVIRAAFEQHHRQYAEGSRAWKISNHAQCRQMAHRAFQERAAEDFTALYEELRRHWQVFRGSKGQHWSAATTQRRLASLPATHGRKKLSECTMNDNDAEGLWKTLESMAGIKRLRNGPSVVAVSKFLHFWNPRLFIIAAGAMIWDKVMTHWWLWDEIAAVRTKVGKLLPGKPTDRSNGPCDLVSYLAILLWAGGLVRENPSIPSEFAEYVKRYSGPCDLPLEEYEAAAVEWLLLGLVELPPVGLMLEK